MDFFTVRGLIHAPAATNGSFPPEKDGSEHRQRLYRPAVHRRVVNKNASLMHYLLDVPKAQWIGHVPAHTGEHDFQRIVKPLEDLVQGAIDQTFVELKYGRDCRLCLLPQNPLQPFLRVKPHERDGLDPSADLD